MRSVSVPAWFFVVLSAVLQVLLFPIAGPVPFWRTCLCWIALVPFFVALIVPDRRGQALSVTHSALLGYVCGICWYLGNCYWIYQTMSLYGGLPKPVALGILLLFSLYLGLYHAIFAALVALLRRRVLDQGTLLLLLPFAWVAVELARARITGFPWDLMGNAQVDNLSLTRIAPYAGAMGLSWIIVAVNAAFVPLFLAGGRGRFALPLLASLGVIFLQCSGYADPSLTTASAIMLQENLEVGAVGHTVKPLTHDEELEEFIRLSLTPDRRERGERAISVQTPLTGPPALIIWPEAPSQLQSNDPAFRAEMLRLADRTQASLIIGSLGVDIDPAAPRGYYSYDSASEFKPQSGYAGRYDKMHLVPWGEYIPFKRFFAFAQKLTEGVGDMDRGTRRSVFFLDHHLVGIFICYESIFGDEVRQFVKKGAEVLVNISDDGWYGDTGAPWQHLNMVRMRAIENHRWVLRSTNTGITTAIDPRGRIVADAPRHVRAAFLFPFAFEHDLTFYTRYGDWFAYVCILVTCAALAFGLKLRMN